MSEKRSLIISVPTVIFYSYLILSSVYPSTCWSFYFQFLLLLLVPIFVYFFPSSYSICMFCFCFSSLFILINEWYLSFNIYRILRYILSFFTKASGIFVYYKMSTYLSSFFVIELSSFMTEMKITYLSSSNCVIFSVCSRKN